MAQHRDEKAIAVLAKNVQKYRIQKGLTQEALANLCGFEYSQISRIERGLLNTSVSVIFTLASKLDVTPGALLED